MKQTVWEILINEKKFEPNDIEIDPQFKIILNNGEAVVSVMKKFIRMINNMEESFPIGSSWLIVKKGISQKYALTADFLLHYFPYICIPARRYFYCA